MDDDKVSLKLLTALAEQLATPNWREIGIAALGLSTKCLDTIDVTRQQRDGIFRCLKEFVKMEGIKTTKLIVQLQRAAPTVVNDEVMDCFKNLTREQKKDYPTDNLLDEISRNIYQPEKFLVGDLHIARELFEKYLPASTVHRKCSLQMMNMWYETNAGNNSLDNLRECLNSGFRRKAISRDEYEALNDTIQRYLEGDPTLSGDITEDMTSMFEGALPSRPKTYTPVETAHKSGQENHRDEEGLYKAFTATGQKLIILGVDNEFKTYDKDEHHWNNVMMAPKWLDKTSSCCTYDSGIVIAGASRRSTGCNVSMLDFTSRETTPLPNLPVPVRSPGITVSDKSIYIIGGSQIRENNREKSKAVYYYSTHGHKEWIKMTPLIHAVVRPIVVSDCAHIYVIGGNTINKKGCNLTQIYDKQNGVWEVRTDLPLPCNNTHNGGVIWNKQPVIVTPTCHMTLHVKDKTWRTQKYGSQLAEWITPVICMDKLYACVRYKHDRSFRRYDAKNNRWVRQNVNVRSIKNTSLFFAVQDDQAGCVSDMSYN